MKPDTLRLSSVMQHHFDCPTGYFLETQVFVGFLLNLIFMAKNAIYWLGNNEIDVNNQVQVISSKVHPLINSTTTCTMPTCGSYLKPTTVEDHLMSLLVNEEDKSPDGLTMHNVAS